MIQNSQCLDGACEVLGIIFTATSFKERPQINRIRKYMKIENITRYSAYRKDMSSTFKNCNPRKLKGRQRLPLLTRCWVFFGISWSTWKVQLDWPASQVQLSPSLEGQNRGKYVVTKELVKLYNWSDLCRHVEKQSLKLWNWCVCACVYRTKVEYYMKWPDMSKIQIFPERPWIEDFHKIFC